MSEPAVDSGFLDCFFHSQDDLPLYWRDYGVDVVDWIETIPFSETRNYVQRVFENLQVYRHRLGAYQVVQSLQQDLTRRGTP